LESKNVTDFHFCLEREIPSLRRYARALTRNSTVGDDLVQETLARAIEKQHLWKPGTDMRAWLFAIMHNQYVNQVRRAVRDAANVEVEGCPQTLIATTDPTALRQLRELEHALGELREEQRQVVLLVGLEGMSYDETAAILNVPVGTVRSRLSRGRETLRQLMNIEDERPSRTPERYPCAAPLAA
jgi:RNA polymerase sigma-70 factor (ECF subfamily)